MALVGRYQQPMLRLARSFVPSQAVAEEAVQDTWLGLVRGIETFEGRSSFKTWLFRILVNRAARQAPRSTRHAPTEALHAVDPPASMPRASGRIPSTRWIEESEQRLDAAAWSPILESALEDLPPRQRQVVLLRDVEGLSQTRPAPCLASAWATSGCLLHRGRSQLRGISKPKWKGRVDAVTAP